MSESNLKTSVLDLKGLVMESYHSGVDPDSIEGGGLKDRVNTAGFGLAVFLSKYYDVILNLCDSPMNMIAVIDQGNDYRKRLFPTYKKKRGERESDAVEKEQIGLALTYAKSFLLSQGVTLISSKGEEADDVIGYLCKHLGGSITVHTVDRDLVQLIKEDVYLFIGGRNVTEMEDRVTLAGQRESLFIPSNLVILYKSLIGDSSDEYGGVKGVGPAAWVKLVEEFGFDGLEELDKLIASKDKTQLLGLLQVTGNKAIHKAVNDFDNWLLMYKIASIAPEIVKPVWAKRVPELARLHKVMQEANCHDLTEKYERDCYTATLVTEENLDDCLTRIGELSAETPFVPWDYETYDPLKIQEFQSAVKGRQYVDVINSLIAGCSFSFGRNVNHVFYFSVDHKDTANVAKSNILDVIKYVESTKKEMIAQNVMFEGTITNLQLSHVLQSWQDTKLFAHHLDENNECGLKALSKRYLNYNQTPYADTLEAAGAADMSDISGADVLGYGADDAVVTGHLYQHFLHRTSIEGTTDFIRDYECGAVPALVGAFIDGVTCDGEAIEKMSAEDKVVMDKTMTAMRLALSERCKEPNFEGVDILFDDQADYYRMKAKALKNSTKESIAESAKVRKAKLKMSCFYEDQAEVADFKPWLPTVAGFNKITKLLGFPDFAKVSKPGIEDWFDELTPEQRKSQFARLIPPAHPSFVKRESDAYKELQKFCTDTLEELSPRITTGTELNLDSPNQNQALMYLLLGLPIRLRTKPTAKSLRDQYSLPGSPSTDSDAIETAMANDCEDHPWKKEFLENLLQYKTAATRFKNYWNVYPLWIAGNNKATSAEDSKVGIVHPGLNSCGTVTRRPTGSNPNLLQISKGETRDMFKAQDAGHVICSIDFSSQELRLNADECQDETWMSAYTGKVPKDLHALTGSRVVGTVLKKAGMTVTYPQNADGSMEYEFFTTLYKDAGHPLHEKIAESRSIGKTVNFSAQFGAQAATLSRNLMVPEEEAQDYLDAYNATFPGLAIWKKKVIAQAKIDGYVETAYGSRRHCPGINSKNGRERSRWERQVVNFKIQGTAADILKVVLTGLHRSKLLEATESYLIAPIYDEVLCEVPKKNLKEFLDGMCDLMSLTVPGGTIPMVPDCSFGPTWGQQTEVGTKPSQETIDKALESM